MNTRNLVFSRMLLVAGAVILLWAAPGVADPTAPHDPHHPVCGETTGQQNQDAGNASTASECAPAVNLDPKGDAAPVKVDPATEGDPGTPDHKKVAPEKRLPQCSDPLYAEANPALCF